MAYKIEKEYKHDYATPWMKLGRKIHGLFYYWVKDRRKLYPLYASYRHRNKKPVEREFKHYITELPAYLAGFGHGLGAWRAGLIASTLFPVEYAYSPMVDKNWDNLLGLGESFPVARDLIKCGYKKVLLPYYDMSSEESMETIRKIIRSYRGRNVVFYNEYEQWTAEGDDIRGDELIRDLFWKSSARDDDTLLYDKNEYNIAVHIRRGDVKSRRIQGDPSMAKRWLELKYYSNLIKQLSCGPLKNKKTHFYIFSEGLESDFIELKCLSDMFRLSFCLDMSAPDVFLHICHADMILAAPSSFSIEAGAICRGKKIVPDREWLLIPDTEEWGRASEDGFIDERKLEKWFENTEI